MSYRFDANGGDSDKKITLEFTSGNTVTLGIDEGDTTLSLKKYISRNNLGGLDAGYGRIVLSSLDDEAYNLYENTTNAVISVTIRDRITTTNVDLRGEDFEDEDLRHNDFSMSNLSDANFLEADLTMADFSEADLQRANLQADLSGTDFSMSNLSNANLSDSYLEETSFYRANLSNANLEDSKFISNNFEDANLSNANLLNCNFYNVIFSGANLSYANLRNIMIEVGDFSGVNFLGADLSNATLKRCILKNLNMSDANLFRANLSRSNLSRSNLSRSNLSGSNLRRTKMSRVNLSGANLSNADLSGADLSGADLSGADLSGAKLDEANLDGANMTGVIRDILPVPGLPRSQLIAAINAGDDTRIDEILKQIPESEQKQELKSVVLFQAIKSNKAGRTIDLLVNSRRDIGLTLRQFDYASVDRNYNKDSRNSELVSQSQTRNPRHLRSSEKCKTSFDIIMQDDVDLMEYLNADDVDNENEKKDESEKRAIFFVGEEASNLTPMIMSLNQLLYNIHNSVYTSDCKPSPDGSQYNPNELKDAIFQLQFTTRYNVYLRNLIDVILNSDKRVFYILPLMSNGQRIEVPRVASLPNVLVNNPFGNNYSNYVSADHCQGGTDRKMYGIYVCNLSCRRKAFIAELRQSSAILNLQC
jgi:uncharacterized protein YjbI with pentapeptide repeats